MWYHREPLGRTSAPKERIEYTRVREVWLEPFRDLDSQAYLIYI
jgi:hypothetical protein